MSNLSLVNKRLSNNKIPSKDNIDDDDGASDASAFTNDIADEHDNCQDGGHDNQIYTTNNNRAITTDIYRKTTEDMFHYINSQNPLNSSPRSRMPKIL